MLSLTKAPSTDYLKFIIWTCITAFSIAAAIRFENVLFVLPPFILAFAWMVILNYRVVFYIFFLLLPFSVEYNFTPSLGTDLPSEPLMIIMLGITLILFSSRVGSINLARFYHPITILLLLHLAWIFVSTVLSQSPMLSFKVFLAKVWYIVPFYFFSIHVLKTKRDVEKMIKCGVFTLAISVMIVVARHYMKDFSFDTINSCVAPLFRNHVTYACIIVVMIPLLYTLLLWEKRKGMKALYILILLLYVVATYFSYTRAAILSIILMPGAYLIIKFRLMRHALLVTLIGSIIGVGAMLYNNNYLRYNPDFNKVVTQEEFNKLITATYKMEDISTMERVYRWVAGVQMVQDKPLFGFGPGCFYTYYSGYTVSSFQTYVSDNPDHSTVHNYYLLTLIEQGFFGFFIFIALCFAVLIYGEQLYHRLTIAADKAIVMAALLCFITILLLNLINDMIETDKVGPFFFLSMSIVVNYWYKESEARRVY
jgi:O-antigen ligase